MPIRPISSSSRPGGAATGCLVVFFSVFALVGAAGFWVAMVQPLVLIFAARSWRETSCVILSSQVAESSGSKGGTYKPDILFTYSVCGRSYQSRQYRFGDVFSSGREGKEKIVAAFPPGMRAPCWVDPADPRQAVLERGLSPALLVGLFPLLFLAIGAGGITWAVHAARSKPTPPVLAADPSAAFGVAAPAGATGDGSAPVELRPTLTPLGKLAAFTFFSLFWNGIVSVFLVQIYQERGHGSPDGCAMLFLVPFVLVGLLMIVVTLRQILVLFNPRVHLTLNPGTLAVGGIAYLQWRLGGRGGGVRRLRILLEGREEAWYQSGKSTHTARNTFASIVVADTAQPLEIPEGNVRVDVPENTMPSFKAVHNKIVWSLKVTCEIAGWPDSEDEYEVLVRPAFGGGGSL